MQRPRDAVESLSPELRDRAYHLSREALAEGAGESIVSAIVGAFLG